MADIEVKIQLQDTVEDNIRVIESPNDVNNASIQKVETAFNRLSVLNDGMNLKSWATGSLSLADGVVGGSDTSLVEQYGYEGYVFGAVPESKEFPVTIEITGRDIDNIIVYGDKEANQFPTKAYRDSNPNDIIYNNDVDWDITFNDKANTHTITFLEWNRANYNACISHISVKSLSLILGKKWIKNVESLSQSTDRPNEIYYGVLPNSGNLSLVDIDGSLKNYAEEGHFDDANLSIGIFANGKEVKRHISSDSHYDNVARTLEVILGDTLSNWEESQYKGFAYPKKSENAYNMLLDVFVSIGYTQNQVDKMLSTEIIYGVDNQVGSVKQYLQEITIPYPYLPSASVRETIDKFCVLAQLQVYRNDRNEIKFVSARPLATNLEKTNVIPINENRMFENFTKSILLKNKYKYVEISEKKPNDIVDYGVVIGNVTDTNISIGNQGVTTEYDKSFAKDSNSNIAWLIRAYSYVDITAVYKTGTITIPKKSNYNLNEIEKFYIGLNSENEPNIKFTLNYTNTIYNCSAKYNGYSSTDVSNITLGTKKSEKNGSGTIESLSVSNTSSHTYGSITTAVTASKSLSNKTNLSTLTYELNEKGDYVITYKVLVGRKTTKLGAYTRQPSGVGSGDIYEGSNDTMTGTQEHLLAKSLDITFYGDKRTITFEDISQSDEEITESLLVKIDGNDLIQENSGVFTTYNKNFDTRIDGDNVIVTARHIIPEDVELTFTGVDKDDYLINEQYTFEGGIKTKTYNFPNVAEIQVSEVVNLDTGDEMGDWTIGTKMSDIIKINIKEDYVTGVSNATLSVPCLDYYNENGEKVKDWSKGEMLEVHDIIRVQGDKTLWRITGRIFRKQGIPMLDLELQQIKE